MWVWLCAVKQRLEGPLITSSPWSWHSTRVKTRLRYQMEGKLCARKQALCSPWVESGAESLTGWQGWVLGSLDGGKGSPVPVVLRG